MELTNRMKVDAELAMRDLSQKAYEVYSGMDSLEVYKLDDGTFVVKDADGCQQMTFEELQEMLEEWAGECNG